MPRGYRCIVVAFVGWLSLAAAPQPAGNDAAPKQTSAPEIKPTLPPALAPEQSVESPLYKQPCANSAQDRQSDLCAQWETAEAGRDAAFWTMIGVLVGIVGTAGLLAQIWLTRQALDVAMSDRRPSVYADDVSYKIEDGKVKAEFAIKNFGQSEADNVAITVAASFGPYPLPANPPPLRVKSVAHGKLHPGATRWQYVQKDNLAEYRERIAAEKSALFLTGHIAYTDRFGRSYTDRFDYFTTGKDFERRALRVCPPWELDEQEAGDDGEQGSLGL